MLRLPFMADLRTMIARAGGLHTRAGLAKRWGVSQQYVGEAAKRDDFPAPIEVDGGELRSGPVWLASEADAWRRTPRRPPD